MEKSAFRKLLRVCENGGKLWVIKLQMAVSGLDGYVLHKSLITDIIIIYGLYKIFFN